MGTCLPCPIVQSMTARYGTDNPAACSKDIQVSGKQSGYDPLKEKYIILGIAKCTDILNGSLGFGNRVGGHFPTFFCQGEHAFADIHRHPFRGAFHKCYTRLDFAVGEALGLFRDDELHLHSTAMPFRIGNGIMFGRSV